MNAEPHQQDADKDLVRPLEAVLRKPKLALFPVVVLTVCLILFQVITPVKYSAEGELVFGSVDVAPNQLPGLVTAGQQLASTYARFIPAVLPAVAENVGMSESEVREAVEATNVAQSPIISISATTSNQQRSVDLVNATMEEVKSYVDNFSGAGSYVDPEEIRLQRTELQKTEFAQARIERDQAEVQLNRLNGQVGEGASPQLAGQIEDAVETLVEKQGVVDEISAEIDSLSAAIDDAKDSDPLAATVRPLADAVGTGGDLKGRLIIAIAAGIVLGGLLGVALAMMSANGWNLLSRTKNGIGGAKSANSASKSGAKPEPKSRESDGRPGAKLIPPAPATKKPSNPKRSGARRPAAKTNSGNGNGPKSNESRASDAKAGSSSAAKGDQGTSRSSDNKSSSSQSSSSPARKRQRLKGKSDPVEGSNGSSNGNKDTKELADADAGKSSDDA